MAEEEKVTSKPTERVPIEWYIPENLMTVFASNMVIQKIENSFFKLSFFEIKPLIQLDESAPAPTKIRADCVASVIVTPDKLPRFIEILQKSLDKYVAKQEVI